MPSVDGNMNEAIQQHILKILQDVVAAQFSHYLDPADHPGHGLFLSGTAPCPVGRRGQRWLCPGFTPGVRAGTKLSDSYVAAWVLFFFKLLFHLLLKK